MRLKNLDSGPFHAPRVARADGIAYPELIVTGRGISEPLERGFAERLGKHPAIEGRVKARLIAFVGDEDEGPSRGPDARAVQLEQQRSRIADLEAQLEAAKTAAAAPPPPPLADDKTEKADPKKKS